jgi:hypothetical protein
MIEMNKAESLLRVESAKMCGKIASCEGRRDKAERQPDYWFCAHRHTGDMTIIRARLWNKGDLS